jgi:hypothetical protein
MRKAGSALKALAGSRLLTDEGAALLPPLDSRRLGALWRPRPSARQSSGPSSACPRVAPAYKTALNSISTMSRVVFLVRRASPCWRNRSRPHFLPGVGPHRFRRKRGVAVWRGHPSGDGLGEHDRRALGGGLAARCHSKLPTSMRTRKEPKRRREGVTPADAFLIRLC